MGGSDTLEDTMEELQVEQKVLLRASQNGIFLQPEF